MTKPKRQARFKVRTRKGRVLNTNVSLKLGTERGDLPRIIVAIFDLQGFTNFVDTAGVNKNIVVSCYMNGFLSWLNHRLSHDWLARPALAKFLGDGVMYIWETESQGISPERAIRLMNLCWNMVQSGTRSYHGEFLPEFINRVGCRWDCEYPKRLRVGLSLGHAVKYVRRTRTTDYVSECINIASKLVKFHPEIHFLAHSDIVLGSGPGKHHYIQKKVALAGITKPVAVFIDEVDFAIVDDKTGFQNL